MSLLVNIEDLLSGAIVEGTRMEFKEGWNPTPIMRTVCAFANDFENEGSGYIIVGVQEVNGKPVRPVKGFNKDEFEHVHQYRQESKLRLKLNQFASVGRSLPRFLVDQLNRVEFAQPDNLHLQNLKFRNEGLRFVTL